MEKYDLKYKTASIVEITPSYIGVLMDNCVHYNIGLANKDTEFDIKKNILHHAINNDTFGTPVSPFSRIDEIPEEIRNSINSTIHLDELKEEILIKEEKEKSLKQIKCSDAREEILPSYNELIESLYEKDVKKDSTKYDEILKRIEIAYSLFPLDLGEFISVEMYEEIINGL